MAFACALAIVFSIPAFYLINLKHIWSVCVGQGIFAISLCLYGGIMAVVMVEQVRLLRASHSIPHPLPPLHLCCSSKSNIVTWPWESVVIPPLSVSDPPPLSLTQLTISPAPSLEVPPL
jgi:hypothetical protein